MKFLKNWSHGKTKTAKRRQINKSNEGEKPSIEDVNINRSTFSQNSKDFLKINLSRELDIAHFGQMNDSGELNYGALTLLNSITGMAKLDVAGALICLETLKEKTAITGKPISKEDLLEIVTRFEIFMFNISLLYDNLIFNMYTLCRPDSHCDTLFGSLDRRLMERKDKTFTITGQQTLKSSQLSRKLKVELAIQSKIQNGDYAFKGNGVIRQESRKVQPENKKDVEEDHKKVSNEEDHKKVSNEEDDEASSGEEDDEEDEEDDEEDDVKMTSDSNLDTENNLSENTSKTEEDDEEDEEEEEEDDDEEDEEEEEEKNQNAHEEFRGNTEDSSLLHKDDENETINKIRKSEIGKDNSGLMKYSVLNVRAKIERRSHKNDDDCNNSNNNNHKKERYNNKKKKTYNNIKKKSNEIYNTNNYRNTRIEKNESFQKEISDSWESFFPELTVWEMIDTVDAPSIAEKTLKNIPVKGHVCAECLSHELPPLVFKFRNQFPVGLNKDERILTGTTVTESVEKSKTENGKNADNYVRTFLTVSSSSDEETSLDSVDELKDSDILNGRGAIDNIDQPKDTTDRASTGVVGNFFTSWLKKLGDLAVRSKAPFLASLKKDNPVDTSEVEAQSCLPNSDGESRYQSLLKTSKNMDKCKDGRVNMKNKHSQRNSFNDSNNLLKNIRRNLVI